MTSTATVIPSIKQAADALKDFSIADQARTAVVVGGTRGIGAAVTRSLARIGCRRIFILGRSSQAGNALIDSIHSGTVGRGVQICFIRADISTIEGMKEAVNKIREAVGDEEIDYLFQFQNGKANGEMDMTIDHLEKSFAVQVVSRFVIAYTLAAEGLDLPELDIEDLNLERRHKEGISGLGKMQFRRDSCVLDVINLELQRRYPDYRFFHAFPGVVDTVSTEGMPWPPRAMHAFLKFTIYVQPEYAATMPIYVINDTDVFGGERYLDNNMRPVQPSPWAVKNSAACWDKLCHLAGL